MLSVKDGDTIAVWFSCGAASAVAAKKTVELFADKAKVRIINNPIKEEDADNRRFLKDVEAWIGTSIEFALNPRYTNASCVEVWSDRRFMSGTMGAPCTLELKKKARQHWEKTNYADWHVLGFTSDEKKRSDNFMLTERSNLLPVLIEHNISKDDCFRIIQDAGIDLPLVYKLGYPNANCLGCVKATSPTYWNHLRRVHPEIFADRAKQSREIGARLTRVQGKRIFLDELPIDAKGRSMKTMDFECGIFCEEKLD